MRRTQKNEKVEFTRWGRPGKHVQSRKAKQDDGPEMPYSLGIVRMTWRYASNSPRPGSEDSDEAVGDTRLCLSRRFHGSPILALLTVWVGWWLLWASCALHGTYQHPWTPDARSTYTSPSPLWQPNIFPDIKYPLRGKIIQKKPYCVN